MTTTELLRKREALSAPGWTRDQNNDVHVNPCAMLQAMKVPCTRQMYGLASMMLIGVMQFVMPHTPVILE